MGKKPKRKPAAERPSRLAPSGPDVRVQFNDYAEMRFDERLAPEGITREEFIAAVRVGNTKKKDEVDPNGTAEEPRFRRYVQLRCGDRLQRIRVILFIRAPQTDTDPGEIEILNVMIVKAETGR